MFTAIQGPERGKLGANLTFGTFLHKVAVPGGHKPMALRDSAQAFYDCTNNAPSPNQAIAC